MTAKTLLKAHFHGQMFKGKTFEPIVKEVLFGEIQPKKTYIQTFKQSDFWQIAASVVFLTEKGEECYLYKVD